MAKCGYNHDDNGDQHDNHDDFVDIDDYKTFPSRTFLHPCRFRYSRAWSLAIQSERDRRRVFDEQWESEGEGHGESER